MSDEFSVRFGPALEAWSARQAQGPFRERVEALRASYKRGAVSSHVDLGAYVAVRAPATFAAVSTVLSEVTRLAPDFAPLSMSDIGSGPGTASFAAAAHFPSLARTLMIEPDHRFARLAEELSASLPFAASLKRQTLLEKFEPADLVVAAYVLAELPVSEATRAAKHLWAATNGALVLVEPGTPEGFARIKAARTALLSAGAGVIGPCTQEGACPMEGADWCHFKARLQRSRAHMHAKGGTVPFEDEAYSWLAVARFAAHRPDARILMPPKANKTGISLRLCGASGLQELVIASRDKAPYKRARKLKWGDGFSRNDIGAP